MGKAVLNVNLVTGNVVGARNARTNRVVAVTSAGSADSRFRLKAKKPTRQIDEAFNPILFVGIATHAPPLSQFSVYLVKDWLSLEK